MSPNQISHPIKLYLWSRFQIAMNVSAGFVGMFLGNAMGPYLSIEMFGYVSLVPNILFMILFSLIPESPCHYLLHGDIDKAEASLKWFRRETDVKAELQELQEFVDGTKTNICLKLKEFFMPSMYNIFHLNGSRRFLNGKRGS